ncbi:MULTISPECIES: antitoxin Xre/MbcA/ParS toxin-binding domain-containing protein [Alphaproteobacteria]|uniref:antitoxin Xre/MbcA/ParS toxin-binding domain-containing protein n=1 Tax=Alphaproteobacteria TaxID=28211 RepID=UPI001478B871|nr:MULTISPECIES: antitoxin Xre/MbcA/ParS toxin-binding domain-containing protein [Alphaproteobacteria]
MIARQGDVNGHSFAHKSGSGGSGCASAGETELHRRGKEIIERAGMVTVPRVTVIDGIITQTAGKIVQFEEVLLEYRDGDVVPDIVGIHRVGLKTFRMFIEIKNTHGCPQSKLDKLALMDVSVMEIDLSRYRHVDLDDLTDIVLQEAPRYLIQSPAISLAKKKIEEDRLVAEKERIIAEARLAAEAQSKIVEYRKPGSLTDQVAIQTFHELHGFGLGELLELDDALPSAFTVTRKLWQSVILMWLIDEDERSGLKCLDIVERISSRGWVKPGLRWIDREQARTLAETDPDFRLPYDEVLSYLNRLVVNEACFKTGKSTFAIRVRIVQKVHDVLFEREVGPKRKAKLLQTFQRIMETVRPEEGGELDFEIWLDLCAARYNVAVDTLLEHGSTAWESFHASVEQIASSLGRKPPLKPQNLEGLPLGGVFERLMETYLQEEARKAELRQQQLHLERDARRRRISDLARQHLHFGADEWLASKIGTHGEKTPTEMADESEASMAKAVSALFDEADRLGRLAEARKVQERYQMELTEYAHRFFRSPERAELWLKSSHPSLGSRRPIDVCLDERSMKLCVQALEPKQTSRAAGSRRP